MEKDIKDAKRTFKKAYKSVKRRKTLPELTGYVVGEVCTRCLIFLGIL